jgi:heme exporter protein D
MVEAQSYFAMGGYGLFVWGAYGFAALVLGAMTIASLLRLRRAERALGTANNIATS